MDELIFSISPKLICRSEGTYNLLFNKENGAIIKIVPFIWDVIKKGSSPNSDQYQKILSILSQNKIITFAQETKNEPCVNEKKLGKSTFNNIFDLHSHLNPFVILWAITAHCNLRCVYCFPNVKSVQPMYTPFSLNNLNRIVDQIIAADVFQLTITGGEAFLEKHFWEIMPRLYSSNMRISVISNGTNITKPIIENLLKYELIVAISLDGPNEKVNSKTRGKGVFQKTLDGIKLIKSYKIPVVILVTLTRYNFPVLFDLIKLIADMGITDITIQDLRPFGNKEDYDALRLTKDQEGLLRQKIVDIKESYPKINYNFTELFIFPNPRTNKEKNGYLMQCPAGDNLGYIDFHGDMYPCTSLPNMKLGNVLEDASITELWRSSEVIKELRNLKKKKIDDLQDCANCSINKYCDGGCRGDSFFYHGDLYRRPSRCPKLMELL